MRKPEGAANRGDSTRLSPELEETLNKYVRGALDGGVREELEELLLSDPDAFEALGVVEDEWIEQYLDPATSVAERQVFERHFLACPEWRPRVDFARALRARAKTRRVGEAATPVGAAAAPVSAPVATVSRRTWNPARLGLAAMLAASLAGNVWLASRQLGPGQPGSGSRTQTAATFALAPGLLRAGGSLPRLTLPADVAVVHLRLELAADEYPAYRAALLDETGAEAWSVSNLTAHEERDATAVVLIVPAALLPSGDHRVKLSGVSSKGEVEGIATYPFRIASR